MTEATGLIHATPTGMDKLPGLPLPASLLCPDLWVSESVYFPIETELVKAARKAGCATVDGGGMAFRQDPGDHSSSGSSFLIDSKVRLMWTSSAALARLTSRASAAS